MPSRRSGQAKKGLSLRAIKIVVRTTKVRPNFLLREFLADVLHSELQETQARMMKGRKVEVFGDLKFEIVDEIDGRKQRIAKLKGNKILIKLGAVTLPKSVLRYVIAHEMAYIFTKRHSKKFWKTVELICPNFEKSQEVLKKYGDLIQLKLEDELIAKPS